jgi:hypothetical protein
MDRNQRSAANLLFVPGIGTYLPHVFRESLLPTLLPTLRKSSPRALDFRKPGFDCSHASITNVAHVSYASHFPECY